MIIQFSFKRQRAILVVVHKSLSSMMTLQNGRKKQEVAEKKKNNLKICRTGNNNKC